MKQLKSNKMKQQESAQQEPPAAYAAEIAAYLSPGMGVYFIILFGDVYRIKIRVLDTPCFQCFINVSKICVGIVATLIHVLFIHVVFISNRFVF